MCCDVIMHHHARDLDHSVMEYCNRVLNPLNILWLSTQ